MPTRNPPLSSPACRRKIMEDVYELRIGEKIEELRKRVFCFFGAEQGGKTPKHWRPKIGGAKKNAECGGIHHSVRQGFRGGAGMWQQEILFNWKKYDNHLWDTCSVIVFRLRIQTAAGGRTYEVVSNLPTHLLSPVEFNLETLIYFYVGNQPPTMGIKSSESFVLVFSISHPGICDWCSAAGNMLEPCHRVPPFRLPLLCQSCCWRGCYQILVW